MQRADGKRNGDALALQFVPNIGPDGVIGFIDPGMISHVKLDLVDDGMVGEVDEKNSDRRILQHVGGIGSGPEERVFHPVRRHRVIDPDANAHGMNFGGIMQVDDGLADDLIVRDIEVNAVVGAQTGGAPVDLHDLGVILADVQPVPDLVGPVDLQRHPGNDAAEQILPGETDDDGDDARARQEALEFAVGVIAGPENNEQGDQEKQEGRDFTQEVGNRRLLSPFEIKIPDVTVDEGDDDGGAQQD